MVDYVKHCLACCSLVKIIFYRLQAGAHSEVKWKLAVQELLIKTVLTVQLDRFLPLSNDRMAH